MGDRPPAFFSNLHGLRGATPKMTTRNPRDKQSRTTTTTRLSTRAFDGAKQEQIIHMLFFKSQWFDKQPKSCPPAAHKPQQSESRRVNPIPIVVSQHNQQPPVWFSKWPSPVATNPKIAHPPPKSSAKRQKTFSACFFMGWGC